MTVNDSGVQALADLTDTALADRHDYHLHRLLQWRREGKRLGSHPLAQQGPLANAARMGQSRDLRRLTEFDGNLTAMATTAGFGPQLRQSPVSATSLESWATCPFRYFLGHVLRLSALETPEEITTISAMDRGLLGCVDILVMMLVCQMLSCQQNNGTGFSISCVAAPACMSLRKKIASDLSRPFCGLTAPAPNGDCFRPNTGIGTVSINDSPVGLTKASGSRCFNISPATRTWNT